MRFYVCSLLLALSLLIAPSYGKPMLVLQGDKTYQFRAVVVSNRGVWLASGDHNGSNIKVFEGKSGLQWGELPSGAGATPLRFTPDATRILTTKGSDAYNGERTQVSLYTVPGGRKVCEFAIAPFPVWCDNTRLRGIQEDSVVEFDLISGKRNFVRKIQESPQSGPRFAFSENGAFLVEGSGEVIRFWSAQTGHLLGRIKDPQRAIGMTAISNDGKRLASEGDDPDWSPPADDGPMSEAAYARTFRLHVWNAQTSKLIRTFPGYYSLAGGASLLGFSPDARTLFGAGRDGLDRFNIASGKNTPLPQSEKNSANRLERPLHVSSDGLWLAGAGQIYGSSDFGPGLSLWSMASSKLRARSAGTLRGISRVKWSPDGKYLAGGDRLTLWDARTGKLLAEKPRSYFPEFVWVDATTIRSQEQGKMQIWSVPDLKLKFEFDVAPRQNVEGSPFWYSDGLSISPNGRTVLTTDTTQFAPGPKGELWVWSVESKQVLRKIKAAGDSWSFTDVSRVLWLPDNRHVVFGTRNKLVLLDTQTGTVEKEQVDPNKPDFTAQTFDSTLRPRRVSPDGKWVAVTAVSNQQVLIFDLKTFALNPPQGLQWWQNTTLSKRKLRAAGAPTAEGNLSPDGKLMAYGNDNMTQNGVSIWNVKERRAVIRLYLLGGTMDSTSLDWITLTPTGFYNASPGGEKRLRWREGTTFWPLAKSRARFKRPDLVARALKPQS